jgi:hypothetical protein
MALEVLLDAPATVRFVPNDAAQTPLGSATAVPLHRAARYHWGKPDGFVALPKCQHQRHERPPAVAVEMDCGAETTLTLA